MKYKKLSAYFEVSRVLSVIMIDKVQYLTKRDLSTSMLVLDKIGGKAGFKQKQIFWGKLSIDIVHT